MEPYLNIDITKIKDAYDLWKRYLSNVQVYYAMKCNPHPHLLRYISKLGIYFDCASKQEMVDVLSFTSPEHIIYANPCKFNSHIRYAKEKGVTLTVVDCECEMYKMKELYPECRLLIRICVKDDYSQCPLSTKFGCAMHDVPSLLILSKQLGLQVVGFSFHVGSGCTQPTLYYDALCDCRVATEMAESIGIPIAIIDIGGGFTHTHFVECAAQVVKGMVGLEGKQFISEVGRFLVETCATLYVNVICKKVTDKRIYYLNDGIYGNLNCKIFDHAKPVLQHSKSGELFESTVYGPTCDSLDIIEETVWLPELDVGDQLYVENFGAYTNASATTFNGYSVESILSALL